jgi:hypothetical protein
LLRRFTVPLFSRLLAVLESEIVIVKWENYISANGTLDRIDIETGKLLDPQNKTLRPMSLPFYYVSKTQAAFAMERDSIVAYFLDPLGLSPITKFENETKPHFCMRWSDDRHVLAIFDFFDNGFHLFSIS